MRTITYIIHVKLFGSNNQQGGVALKSHCFSVAHDGPSIASEHMAVNMGCLAAFTVTFIGRGTAFRALQSIGGSKYSRVDPEQSLRWLVWTKEAGHPLYQAVDIPHLDTISHKLYSIQQRATVAMMHHDDAILQIAEQRLENQDDGESALMAPNGNFSHDAMVHGIAELVQGATKIDSDAAGPDTGAGRNADEAEDDTKVDDEEQVTKEDENIDAPAQVQAQMDTGLLNEFQQNDFIIGGSFPMEFPLGVPDTYAVGHLPAHVSRRLLQSYLPQFERCTEFIFMHSINWSAMQQAVL